jgi:hypothetical protein
MEWFPIVFFTFKILVLGTGMFFAVKWHYDQAKKGKQTDKRDVLRGVVKVVAAFAIALLLLGFITYAVLSKLSLDLS